ncbi:hypothetical protein [Solibacillus sp. FSL W8-0372]|uniref:hypothetical protein n=1 Tax=Solibacillus sp. FSL W8-0372 TaxID=2921713 RepID=UPI0030CB9512
MGLSYFEINNILSRWASNSPSIVDFTVENILDALELDDTYYNQVFKYLMSKNEFELIAKKILLCPNNHKCDEFLLDEPVEEDYFDCYSCSENDFEPENFILVFSFTEDYLKDVQKKKSQIGREYMMV